MAGMMILVSDDDARKNFSHEAYAAFTEQPLTVNVPMVDSGVQAQEADGPVLIEEQLSGAQVEEMLKDEAPWRLSIPDGSETWVLSRDWLEAAWKEENGGRTVEVPLRRPTDGELAVLAYAREQLSPKAGAERFKAALGVPLASLSVVVAAAGAFVGFRADSEIARPWALTVAGGLVLLAVIGSLLGSMLLTPAEVRLSRIDLLQRRTRQSTRLPRALFVLFALALVLAVISIVPPDSPDDNPYVTFGTADPVQQGSVAEVSYEVAWEDLPDAARTVRIVSRPAGGAEKIDTATVSDGSATEDVRVDVGVPGTIVVRTQALDADERPVGDTVEHTYTVR